MQEANNNNKIPFIYWQTRPPKLLMTNECERRKLAMKTTGDKSSPTEKNK